MIATENDPIGIFDSGVGGLSVLKAIRDKLPHENLIYLADTRHTPYGEKDLPFIESRVSAIAEFLLAQSVKMMVVACNTATAAAVHLLREKYTLPILGLEPALKPAAEFSQNKKIGVLATQSTLKSEKYASLKQRFAGDLQLLEKACPLFVRLVESAAPISPETHRLIQQELQPFIDAKVDALVLGCTHYPFLTQTIREIMGEQVRLFESANPVANEVARRLQGIENPQTQTGWTRYHSSAPSKAQNSFNWLLKEVVDISRFQ